MILLLVAIKPATNNIFSQAFRLLTSVKTEDYVWLIEGLSIEALFTQFMTTSEKHSHGSRVMQFTHLEHLHTGINNSLATWPSTLHCLQGVRMMIKGVSLFIKSSTSSLTASCQT